jgi:hypothetical protein
MSRYADDQEHSGMLLALTRYARTSTSQSEVYLSPLNKRNLPSLISEVSLYIIMTMFSSSAYLNSIDNSTRQYGPNSD